MKLCLAVTAIAALVGTTSLTAPLAAKNASVPANVSASARVQSSSQSDSSGVGNGFAQFAPASQRREHRIDYEHWDEALGWFVVPMGPSIRQGAPRVEPGTGTRRIYGHVSRYRLEGNRVAFSYLTDDIRASISDYRADLEQVGSTLDVTAIPRNEQLAFWINLHNVAVIEALAGEYPLSDSDAGLHDTKLVTVAGVALSPRDIREQIVYPNWRDPKVIYGFWHGVIGGPSIQRLAYTGGNVDALLALSAEEFVNSLRGVERWGGTLRVSPVYQEAAQFYFADTNALRVHLTQYAREDVRDLISRTPEVEYKRLETDLADLAGGDRDPALNFIASQDCGGFVCTPSPGNATPIRTRPNLAIQRLMTERAEKLRRARARGIRSGMVIYGDGEYSPENAPEVE